MILQLARYVSLKPRCAHSQVKEENTALANYLTEVQAQKQELQAQLARLQGEWAAANSNNLRLMEEVSTKRNSLQVRTTPCE